MNFSFCMFLQLLLASLARRTLNICVRCLTLLVLARVEFIFFTVASIGLSFGFVLNTRVDTRDTFLLLLRGAYP